VGRRGFEPLKSKDSGFTVRPIWPLWNLPPIIKKLNGANLPINLRAKEGTRTPDRLITNQLLYQLSYFGFNYLVRCTCLSHQYTVKKIKNYPIFRGLQR